MSSTLEKTVTGVIAGTVLVVAGYVYGVDEAFRRAPRLLGFSGLPTCGSEGNESLPDIGFPTDASEQGVSANASGTRVSYVWNGIEYEVYYGPGCQMSKLLTSPSSVK